MGQHSAPRSARARECCAPRQHAEAPLVTVPSTPHRSWPIRTAWAVAIALSIGALGHMLATGVGPFRSRYVTHVPSAYSKLTAADLAHMTDAQLEAMDPLAMNLIVARELPPLQNLDIARYSATVDDWARRIDAGNREL